MEFYDSSGNRIPPPKGCMLMLVAGITVSSSISGILVYSAISNLIAGEIFRALGKGYIVYLNYKSVKYLFQ